MQYCAGKPWVLALMWNVTKSSRHWPGLRIPQIPIWLSICGMCWYPTLQPTGPKGSATSTVVPDSTGHPRRPCVHASPSPVHDKASDLLSHGYRMGYHYIPWMLNWTGIWGIWRPSWCLDLFATFLVPFLSSTYSVAWNTVLLPSGSAGGPKGFIWSVAVFGLVVWVKWHPHECQDPRFPSRTLHCNKTIIVIQFTCQ